MRRAPLVLVVEDEPAVRAVLAEALARDGFELVEASDGLSALDAVARSHPDLVILDLGLPRMSGLDVLREIRADGDVPVIVVTGQSGEADRVVGLELGADDYVTKPFSPREVVARVRRVLHRTQGAGEAAHTMDFGELVIDPKAREVHLKGEPVELTRREFDLLAYLASSPRQVFSTQQILREVWGSEPGWQHTSTVTEHVYRLRSKLRDRAGPARWIRTVRGVGYRFVPDQSPAAPGRRADSSR